mmetsp:Transcript_30538/g.35600  ORF Transcript_30538/g.35600 Transcript_30538/m.35600 type:complete len:449 (-) Transcript_30538:222-1568(-)
MKSVTSLLLITVSTVNAFSSYLNSLSSNSWVTSGDSGKNGVRGAYSNSLPIGAISVSNGKHENLTAPESLDWFSSVSTDGDSSRVINGSLNTLATTSAESSATDVKNGPASKSVVDPVVRDVTEFLDDIISGSPQSFSVTSAPISPSSVLTSSPQLSSEDIFGGVDELVREELSQHISNSVTSAEYKRDLKAILSSISHDASKNGKDTLMKVVHELVLVGSKQAEELDKLKSNGNENEDKKKLLQDLIDEQTKKIEYLRNGVDNLSQRCANHDEEMVDIKLKTRDDYSRYQQQFEAMQEEIDTHVNTIEYLTHELSLTSSPDTKMYRDEIQRLESIVHQTIHESDQKDSELISLRNQVLHFEPFVEEANGRIYNMELELQQTNEELDDQRNRHDNLLNQVDELNALCEKQFIDMENMLTYIEDLKNEVNEKDNFISSQDHFTESYRMK